MNAAPPRIFSKARKIARIDRARSLAANGGAAAFLLENMADDIEDRLAFVRHPGGDVLLEGFGSGIVVERLMGIAADFSYVTDQDFGAPAPFQSASFDLVASINSLDTVNDLPGALIQMRELLKPGGMVIACFIGGASLGKLRQAMIAAEPDRPAARMHPLIDPRSCPQLLSRAGWADPVVDSYRLTVRYPTLDRLVQDLREMAMGNVLASPAPPLTRVSRRRAREAFAAMADDDGKVSETFEIITLTGRRSLAGT